ncbi:MAG TPA: nucleoside/nucleotide kinase family protein [Pseudonocardiaceae bacterium]|jgi:pantothenate kinase|nr:nucleoside/nucleotide kinase family protein [Pseudonocardiaceae bacterium]
MTTFEELLAAATVLAAGPQRRILGIVGAPGAGKSTLAAKLVEALDGRAVLVGMDGFHFANTELARLGRAERKGAPDTFDAAGYVALLRRLRAAGPEVVYAPEFRREIEEPIGSAVPVPPEVPLVVTEGNYLLLDTPPWHEVRPLLDEAWFLRPAEDERVRRLVDRHRAYGRSLAAAKERALGSDQRNANTVAATALRADRVIPGF